MPRRRPKKIVTWRYDDGAGTTMDIPVYQVIGHDGIWLRVDIPELSIREECSDVNVLREKVFTAIKGQLVIVWKPFLLISAESITYDLEDFPETTHRNPSLRFDAGVRVVRIEIGTRPDGSTCHRKPEYGSSVRDGLPELDDGEDSETRHEVQSLVSDTRENRQALVELGRRLFEVGRELCARLDARNVDRALACPAADGTLSRLSAPAPGADTGNTKGKLTCPSRRKR